MKRVLVAMFGISITASTPSVGTLGVLRGFPVPQADKDDGTRDSRLQETASQIDLQAKSRLEKALLLTTGEFESHWARYVQLDEDRCRLGVKGSCDKGLAWGFFQVHGTDRSGGVPRMVELALQKFRSAAAYCKGDTLDDRVKRAISLYATGKTCDWPGAEERMVLWRSIVVRL